MNAETIRDFVAERGNNVSFAELDQLTGFRDRENGFEIGWRSQNIVFWSGISEEGCDALDAALDADLIHYHPTSAFIYLLDGTMPQLPVAKQVRTYKQPHWLPVVLKLGPNPMGRRAKA